MKEYPIRRFVFVTGAVLLVYLVAYCVAIERVVLRAPSTTSADGEIRTQLIRYPTVRGSTGGHPEVTDIVWHIFKPAFEVDRQFIRRAYWEMNVEIQERRQ